MTQVLRHWPTVIGSLLAAASAAGFAAQNVFKFGAVHNLPPAPTVMVAGIVVTGCLMRARTRLVIDEIGLLVVGPLFTTSLTWSEIQAVEPVTTRMHTCYLLILCETRQVRALRSWNALNPFTGIPQVLVTAAGLIDLRLERYHQAQPEAQPTGRQVLRHWPTIVGWLFLALLGAIGAALGLSGLVQGGDWTSAAFLAGGVLVTAWGLLLARSRTVLEPDGLTVVGALRSRRVAWADVSQVRVRLSISRTWTIYVITGTGPVDVLHLWWTLRPQYNIWMWGSHAEPPRLAPPSVHRAYRAVAAHLPH